MGSSTGGIGVTSEKGGGSFSDECTKKKLSHPSTDPSLFLKSKNYEFEVLPSFEVFKRYVLPNFGHQLHDKLLGLTENKAPNFPHHCTNPCEVRVVFNTMVNVENKAVLSTFALPASIVP